ncbi:chemerin-like receptor 1 [Clarias gariepinus]
MCAFQATALVIIVVLGLIGNGLVIWIAGFKIKKTVQNLWYLSLAVSDFLFCAFLLLSIVYIVKNTWVFGRFMCKLTFFFWFLNWFSSIFLLVIISVDRCVVVMFPVWAQNKRTTRRALVIVLLAWIVSALLSLPAAILKDIAIDDYSKQKCSYISMHYNTLTTLMTCLLIFGFVIPLLIIIVSSVLITVKLKNNQMLRSNRPFKIMTALIAAFFICWMPFHFFNILIIKPKYDSIALIGQKIGLILASANSFINPLLYAFMAKDLKKKCYALLSKTESKFEEEAQSTHRVTDMTNSGDNVLSSTV